MTLGNRMGPACPAAGTGTLFCGAVIGVPGMTSVPVLPPISCNASSTATTISSAIRPSHHHLAGVVRPVACAASVSSLSSSSAALCGLIVAATGASHDRDVGPGAVLHLLLDLGDRGVDLVRIIA